MKTPSAHKLMLGSSAAVLVVVVLLCWGCGPKQNQTPGPAASEQSPVSETIPVVNPQPATTEAPSEYTGEVIDVFESTFESDVLQADQPVIVQFWATYCGVCRIVIPIVEDLAKEYAGRLKFVAVDIQANPKLTNQFGVTYIPLLLVFENGKETQRFGFANEQQFRQVVAEIAASAD